MLVSSTIISALSLVPSCFSPFLQDVTVTNDGATILKLLEVEHPAARVLVELAQLQDEEVSQINLFVFMMILNILPLVNLLFVVFIPF